MATLTIVLHVLPLLLLGSCLLPAIRGAPDTGSDWDESNQVLIQLLKDKGVLQRSNDGDGWEISREALDSAPDEKAPEPSDWKYSIDKQPQPQQPDDWRATLEAAERSKKELDATLEDMQRIGGVDDFLRNVHVVPSSAGGGPDYSRLLCLVASTLAARLLLRA